MEGQGRQMGALALCVIGVILVCVVCGLPMWRETSNVGANIVTAQSVWDGLWLHCVMQATGQMQCKRQPSLTSDIQAGRALTLLSIILGLMGFIIALLGGGVANCSGAAPDQSQSALTSRKKASLLGGVLCVLSGILCLVSVSVSAAFTSYYYNDPLVVQSLRREVGSSIYVGWVASVLLLLGGALLCLVCGRKQAAAASPSYYRDYTPYIYSSATLPYQPTYSTGTMRSDTFNKRSSRGQASTGRLSDPANRRVEHVGLHDHNSLSKAQGGVGPYGLNPNPGTQPIDRSTRGSIVRVSPSRAPAVDPPGQNYYNMPVIMDRQNYPPQYPGMLF